MDTNIALCQCQLSLMQFLFLTFLISTDIFRQTAPSRGKFTNDFPDLLSFFILPHFLIRYLDVRKMSLEDCSGSMPESGALHFCVMTLKLAKIQLFYINYCRFIWPINATSVIRARVGGGGMHRDAFNVH